MSSIQTFAGITFRPDAYGTLRGETATGVQVWAFKRGRRFEYGTGHAATSRNYGSAKTLGDAFVALVALTDHGRVSLASH
jgi:hypothetical protein